MGLSKWKWSRANVDDPILQELLKKAAGPSISRSDTDILKSNLTMPMADRHEPSHVGLCGNDEEPKRKGSKVDVALSAHTKLRKEIELLSVTASSAGGHGPMRNDLKAKGEGAMRAGVREGSGDSEWRRSGVKGTGPRQVRDRIEAVDASCTQSMTSVIRPERDFAKAEKEASAISKLTSRSIRYRPL